MYTRLKCVLIPLTAALIATSAFGQAPAPAPAPAPAAAPAPPPWSVGAIDFSGLVDGYYTFNFNHPASANNGLYNFDTKANQFSLNMAKLSMSHAADPVGFQVDFGFGHAFDMINGIDNNGLRTKNIEQAYVSWKPKGKDSGFQMDFGKFVTSAGAEVIESQRQLELLPLPAVRLGDSLLPLRFAHDRNQGPLHGRLPAGQRME